MMAVAIIGLSAVMESAGFMSRTGETSRAESCMRIGIIGILNLRSGKIILRIVGTGLYNSLKEGDYKTDLCFQFCDKIKTQSP